MSKPISKVVDVILSWWMPLRHPLKKTHKIHMNEGHNNDFENMFIKKNVFEKQKNFHFKWAFQNKVQI